ncbi:L,D-transpeptidase [Methylorubrum populi]|uniref:L,D-transpeptidase n=1 Tax=Methylobacterium radiotolerans TaxID=31998 RepID=A0ABU7TDY0_9HYPH
MRLPLHVFFAGAILAAAAPAARADLLIAVDKDAQRMSVAVDGQVRHTWPVSTGVPGHDTPNGSHRPFRMEKTHFSREWDNAPMPHAIFFTQVGHAIHGTTHTRRLGRAASHGCVRLSQRNAATLFALVRQQKMANTRVVIEGSVGEAPVADVHRPAPTRTARRSGADEGVVAIRSRGRAWAEDDFYDAPVRRRGRSPDPFDGGYGPSVGYGDLY